MRAQPSGPRLPLACVRCPPWLPASRPPSAGSASCLVTFGGKGKAFAAVPGQRPPCLTGQRRGTRHPLAVPRGQKPGLLGRLPSAPRAPAPALPSAAGGMRCRGGGRGGIHQPSEGGWQGTVRPSQGENTRLRVRHAAPTRRAGSRTVATPRHPRRRSRQARGGATRRPFSRRETEARRREGGSLPGGGTSTPAGLWGGGSPGLHAVLSAPGPARWLPLPPSRTGGLAHVARGARRLRRLPPQLDVAREAPSRRGRAPLSASPLPGPALSSSRPPSAHSADGPLSNGEPLSRWFSSDGAHRPGHRFGGIRRSSCLPHARPASSRVLLPRPQGS